MFTQAEMKAALEKCEREGRRRLADERIIFARSMRFLDEELRKRGQGFVADYCANQARFIDRLAEAVMTGYGDDEDPSAPVEAIETFIEQEAA